MKYKLKFYFRVLLLAFTLMFILVISPIHAQSEGEIFSILIYSLERHENFFGELTNYSFCSALDIADPGEFLTIELTDPNGTTSSHHDPEWHGGSGAIFCRVFGLEIPPIGIYHIKVIKKDGTEQEETVLTTSNSLSSATPEIITPVDSTNITVSNPVLSWEPFVSPEKQEDEILTYGLEINTPASDTTIWIASVQSDILSAIYNFDGSARSGFEELPAGIYTFHLFAYEDLGTHRRTSIRTSNFIVSNLTHIEITQGIQDENNNVPLIEGKPTLVRVYLDCPGDCKKISKSLELVGFRNNTELGRLYADNQDKFPSTNEPDWTKQRGFINNSLYFNLPTEWISGTVLIQAEIQGSSGGGLVSGYEVTFHPVNNIKVLNIPVRYKGKEPLYPDKLRIESAKWAQLVLPTHEVVPHGIQPLDWSPPDNCVDGSCRKEHLLSWLTDLRIVGGGIDFIFGWISGDNRDDFCQPDGCINGDSDPTWDLGAGIAAFGMEDSRTYPEFMSDAPLVFTHEVGHLLGRLHPDNSSCNAEDNKDATIFPNYGIDFTNLNIKSPESYDFMSLCGDLVSGNVWTSASTYEKIFNKEIGTIQLNHSQQINSSLQTYFVVRGLVFTNNTAYLDPIWINTPSHELSNPSPGSAYCLESENNLGVVLDSLCFDLTFVDYETGSSSDVAGFNLLIPYSPDVHRIILKRGELEIIDRVVSENSPQVTIHSPNGGEIWSPQGTYTISWSGTDLDGDLLTHNVLYSIDGIDWIPLGINTTDTQLIVNSNRLPGSNNATIRVEVSDGVNTSSDESDSTFIVGSKSPEVEILLPAPGYCTSPDSSIYLQGYAYDLEDGIMDESKLKWKSNIDGDIGVGSLLLTTLSSGNHEISLSAEDSDGNSATTTVDVFVGYKTYLPLSIRH